MPLTTGSKKALSSDVSPELKKIFTAIDCDKKKIINALVDICKIPALDPTSGGDGELKKLEFIHSTINDWGFTFKRYDAPDPRISYGYRPNLVCTIKGSDPAQKGAVWVICHTDIVPPGDLSKWTSDPYKPVVTEDKIIGRGTEDNGQDLIAALYGLKAVLDTGWRPRHDVNIALVAEEETGSTFGIGHLVGLDMFGKDDILVVPDGGNEDGTLVEVSEKTILWLKVTTIGKQVHGSLPDKGINAHRAAMTFGSRVSDGLYKKFKKKDPLFDPPSSTFEPTKKEANVPNVNTIPGDDVFYMDMRILPDYDPEDVLAYMRSVADAVEKETGAKFSFEKVQFAPSPPTTPPDSEVVVRLMNAIVKVRPIKPYAGGIGGGTCAALFRKKGLPAAVWSIMDEVGHTPNEYALIKNLIDNTKVFAAFYCDL